MAPRFTVSPHRIDPYKTFRFRVRLDGRTVPGGQALLEAYRALRKGAADAHGLSPQPPG